MVLDLLNFIINKSRFGSDKSNEFENMCRDGGT